MGLRLDHEIIRLFGLPGLPCVQGLQRLLVDSDQALPEA
jgi:hypothetical protein